MILNVFKVFGLSIFTFIVGILLEPALAHYLYKYKAWKKKARNEALGGGETPIFNQLHKEKEIGTPRMGGILVWFSALVVALLFAALFSMDTIHTPIIGLKGDFWIIIGIMSVSVATMVYLFRRKGWLK